MKLVNLVPLKELDINDPALVKYRASRTVNKADNPMDKPSKPTRDLTYAKKLKLDMLKAKRAEIMRDMENNPSVEPEGGPVADDYGDQLNKIDAAIAKLRGTGNMTYDQAIGRVPMNETTEKAWNAIDVSRKAEKEISNKEWNERTTKKLDMLKKLNDAGKFKKDWDEETLQGWVDQNFSWEKISKKFKLNEMYEGTPTVFDDESMEELGDIISKYVKDPDDVQRELDRFDDGGFDAMSNMVTANLLRDPEYKAWFNKLHSIKENNDVRKVIRKIIKEQNFDDRLRSMMGADDFEKATNPKLAKLINNAIMSIDPNMSYRDFAKGVAQVLIDEYGVQNYEPFISELKKALDSTLG